MTRLDFLTALFASVGAIGPAAGLANGLMSMRTAGVGVPDTKLARAATEIARAAEPAEIFNHSLRTYWFAQLIAKVKNIAHDRELVYVASILHDVGLTARYMSARYPFEVDGANVARELMAEHAVARSRQSLAWDAIALHDNGGIAQHKQPEVMLVNSGVSADFGAYLDALKREDIKSVLRAAPRTGFIDVFLDAAASIAKRKPFACAHSFVADVGYCKVRGFHLPSFCDAVKQDPFAAYN